MGTEREHCCYSSLRRPLHRRPLIIVEGSLAHFSWDSVDAGDADDVEVEGQQPSREDTLPKSRILGHAIYVFM